MMAATHLIRTQWPKAAWSAAARRVVLGMLSAGLMFCASYAAAGMCPINGGGSSKGLLNEVSWGNEGWGGITLNKTLTLLSDVDDIKGAAYDPKKGEIVLIGAGTVADPIDLDDLVVAVRTIFAVDAQGFSIDPGIDFGTDDKEQSNIDGKMIVKYSGATKDTQFGQILYDADYVLKKLGQGVDENSVLLRNYPVTAALLAKYGLNTSACDNPQVPTLSCFGYVSAAERLITNQVDFGNRGVRYFFTPKEIELSPYVEGSAEYRSKSFVFSKITMQVCVEVKNGQATELNSCEPGAVPTGTLQQQAVAFANNITQYYDAYTEVPGLEILSKLKRLGKVVSMVRWLRDNNIPVDLSFMADYVPKTPVKTPAYVKMLQLCKDATSPGTVLVQGSGPYVPGSCNAITGGVKYSLENPPCDSGSGLNCPTPAPEPMIVDATSSTNRVLNASTPNDQRWNFTSGSDNLYAIAQTVAPSGKDGGFSFTQVDLAFPNQAGQPLEFVRYYDSFSNLSSGFGPGWSEIPFTLKFPESKGLFCQEGFEGCQPGGAGAFVAYSRMTLVDRISGRTAVFELSGGVDWEDSGVVKSGSLYTSSATNDRIIAHPDGFFIYIQMNSVGVPTKTVWFEEHAHPGVLAEPVAVGTSITLADATALSASGGIWLSYLYGTDGRLEAIEGNNGQRITINRSGGLITRAWYSSGSGTRDVQYAYNSGRLETANRSGRVFRFNYLEPGEPTSGTLANIIDETRGNLVVGVTSDLESRSTTTLPLGIPSLQQTNTFNRPAGTTESVVETPEGTLDTLVQRDEQGRLTQVEATAPTEGADTTYQQALLYEDVSNGLAGPTTITDARGNDTKLAYDGAGNVTSVSNIALGQSVTIARGIDATDGLAITVITDQKNRKSVAKYDDAGRLFKLYRRVQNVTGNQTVIPVEYSFTVLPGDTRTYSYDPVTGAVASISNDLGEAVAVTDRDAFGQPKRITSAAGYETKINYDGLARPTTVQGPSDVSPTTLAYNSSGLEQDQLNTVASAVGSTKQSTDMLRRTSAVTDSRGVTTTYFNNIHNRLERVVERGPGGTVLTTQYVYDTHGKLDFKLLPNGTKVNYSYDGFGRLTGMSEVEGAEAAVANPPTLTLPPPGENALSVGQTFSHTVGVSTTLPPGPGDPSREFRFYLVNAPAGMTIGEFTGVITWAPGADQTGVFDVVVQVADSAGGYANETFEITVISAGETSADNCLNVPNPSQRDSDGDGFGNMCDPDLNNDGIVGFDDLAILKEKFGTSDPNADFNEDGVVNDDDLLILKSMFGSAPGPRSGAVP